MYGEETECEKNVLCSISEMEYGGSEQALFLVLCPPSNITYHVDQVIDDFSAPVDYNHPVTPFSCNHTSGQHL